VIKTMGRVPSKQHRIDYAGATTLGLSLALILIACAWSGTTYAMTSPQVVVPFVAGLLGLVVFALIERRASEPIIPVALLSNRIFVTATGAYFVVGALLFAVSIYMPVYLQDVRGDTPTISGLTTMSYTVGWVVASIIAGRLITRTGRYRIFPIIGASCAAVGVALLILLSPSTTRLAVCAILVLGGVGMGMTVSPYLVAVQNAISPQDFGSSTATLNLTRAIGASLAVSIFGALLASRAKSYLAGHLREHAGRIDISRLVSGGTGAGSVHHSAVVESALLSGLHWVYAVAAIVGLFGIACALALQERPLSDRIAH
jgi:MFS family permease